jgi:carbon monoxide dehydrogenase subunit G
MNSRYGLFLSVFVAASAVASPPIAVTARRDGGMVRLWATLRVNAVPEAVWEVLTDYEHQPQFVPGLTESRVISHDAAGSTVVQKGWFRVLFLRFNVDIQYITRETPPSLLTSRVIRGNVGSLRSEYRISPYDSGARLDYVGEVETQGWLPPGIGPYVIRRQVEEQLGAFVHEIERRQREREKR